MTLAEAARDYQFVSSTKLAQIKTWLSRQLDIFAAAWWCDAATLKCVDVSEFYTDTGLYQEYRIYRNLRCGGEQIVFIGDDSVWRGLFRSMVDGEKIDNSVLSKFVLERFCHEFCRLFVARDSELSEVVADEHEDIINRYGSGCVAVELDVGGIPISVLLTRGIWKGILAPEGNPSPGAVSAVTEALGESKATLSAYFQSDSVDCGALMYLREGDFVPLGQDFTGRVSISCGELPAVFGGVLGRASNGRVVKIQK